MNISSRTIIKVLSITLIFAGVLLLAYMTRRELTWLGTAFFLAVALNPFVENVRRIMPRRHRGMAIGAVFAVVLSLFSFLIVSFVPPLIQQSEALIHNLPHYAEDMSRGNGPVANFVRDFDVADRLRESQAQILGYLSTASSQFINVVQGVFSSVIAAVTILALTFFMLLEGPRWIEALWSVVPSTRRVHARELVQKMYKAVTGYVLGLLLNGSIAALATTIVLSILHVPYAIPLGIFVGIMDLFPMVGAPIAAAIVFLVALVTSPAAGLAFLIFFLIYQQIENHVLQPIVYGRVVEISPLLVLVAIIMGVSLGGILGAIVAIPVFASLQILIKDYTSRHLPPQVAQQKPR